MSITLNDLKNTKNIVFNDTETTGVDPEDRIIEIASMFFDSKGELKFIEELCKPIIPIKPEASMVHGYRNSQVKDKPSFSKLKQHKMLKEANKKGYYYVAHNAPFDIGMLSKEGIEWDEDKVIDTLQVAKHVYNGNENIKMFKLQYFRYLQEFDDQEWFTEAMKMLDLKEIVPHTALSDIFILWLFYIKLKIEFNLTNEKMVELSKKPVRELTISFGNIFEKGELYTNIVTKTYIQYGKVKSGSDYLLWAVNNMDMTNDREFGIRASLAEAMLDKKIPIDFKTLSYAFLYIFEDKAQLKKVLNLKGKEYFLALIKNYEKEADKKGYNQISIPAFKSSEEEQDFKKRRFMYKFFEKYRKNILLNFLKEV